MDQYNKINSLIIDNIDNQNKYLFFDIFNRNNELILICPIYENLDINYDKIIPYYNGEELYYKNIVKCNDIYEQVVVIIFQNICFEKEINIKIKYKEIEKEFIITNLIIDKNIYFLTHTTLFKDDYEVLELFYDYYTKNGVDYFYLYYNGKIFDKLTEKVNNKNIILIEWDFKYYNETETYNHHAQMGQIQHALYKYNKPFSKYSIYADLDEYIYFKDKTIVTYLKNNIYDFYRFLCIWVGTIDDNIPDKFPDKIKIDIKYISVRSKCIYENNKFYMVGIHFPRFDSYKYNYDIINTDIGRMLHFYNWTGVDRQLNDYTVIYI